MAKPDTNVINLRPEAATISPARPCWAVYEHWVTNENGRKLRPGVYRHSFKRSAADQDDAENDAADQPITDEWISTPVTVVARTTNSDDGSEGRLLRLVTEGGIKEWIIAMEVFGGSGEDARRALFGMGVIIALKKRGTFMEYLLDQHPAEVFATTCRPGWHDSGAFVLPGRTIGSANVRYQASNKAQVLFSQRGELALWQSQVAAKCAGNPVLTLAIGCSLAGPLLSLVGVLGGGVHLVGDSSSGKSLAQLIGSSVWGDPGVFAASWDMTKGGLEIEASSRNDTILPLDEIKRADPKRVQEMAYSLANGQGKGTMTREREGRAKLSWRLLTLSSGERSLSEHAAISGNAAHAGAELRMVDVNAGTRTHRAFDDLHGLEGADFHRQLQKATTGKEPFDMGTAMQRLQALNGRIYSTNDRAEAVALGIVKKHLINAIDNGETVAFNPAPGMHSPAGSAPGTSNQPFTAAQIGGPAVPQGGVVPFQGGVGPTAGGAGQAGEQAAPGIAEAFRAARSAAADRFRFQEASPLIEKMIKGNYAPEDLPNIIGKMKVDQLKDLSKLEQQRGVPIMSSLQDAARAYIRDASTLQSETGGTFSINGLRKALDTIGPEKGKQLFGNDGWAEYQRSLRVGGAIMNPPLKPAGSTTAPNLLRFAQTLGKLPIPGAKGLLDITITAAGKAKQMSDVGSALNPSLNMVIPKQPQPSKLPMLMAPGLLGLTHQQ